MDKFLRYDDLVAMGLVNNRNTLKNWIRNYGFPPGKLVGPNSRRWCQSEVEAFIKTKLSAPKWFAVARKPRGRPRGTFNKPRTEPRPTPGNLQSDS